MLGRCTLRVWSAGRRQVAGSSGHSGPCALRRLELIGDVGESCSSGSLSLLGGQPGKFSKILVRRTMSKVHANMGFQIAYKDMIPSYSFLFANKTVTSQMTNTSGQKEGMVSFFNQQPSLHLHSSHIFSLPFPFSPILSCHYITSHPWHCTISTATDALGQHIFT